MPCFLGLHRRAFQALAAGACCAGVLGAAPLALAEPVAPVEPSAPSAEAAPAQAAADAVAESLFAEPADFTLKTALSAALRQNPTILAAEARLTQAKLEKEQQDLWWARTLRANVNYNMLGNQGGGGTVTPDGTMLPAAAVGLNVNLGDVLAGPKNSQRAAEAVKIAEAELRRTTLEVAAQVTAAYQEYQAAKQLAALTPDMLAAAETDVRVAERQFARGGSAVNTLLGARLAAQRVRADQLSNSGNVLKAWTHLLTVMGSADWLLNAQTEARDLSKAERR